MRSDSLRRFVRNDSMAALSRNAAALTPKHADAHRMHFLCHHADALAGFKGK
jgi:hypothetical protein